MKSYFGVKIPKCNGKPQLWCRSAGGLRIIMPDGQVDWCMEEFAEKWGDYPVYLRKDLKNGYTPDGRYMYACTVGESQLDAIKNSIRYDQRVFSKYGFLDVTEFLGYIE